MKKFSLFAILLGFNIALGACSDDDAAPVVKNEIFQLPEKAYVWRNNPDGLLSSEMRRRTAIFGVGILILPVFLLHSRVGLSIRVK